MNDGTRGAAVPLFGVTAGAVGRAAAGATTRNDADAAPPVGRVALITYEPAVLGAANEVEKAPPADVVTDFEPVGLDTVMLALPGKYEP